MTYQDLLAELSARNALIVHCSRPGKAGELIPTPLYPDDLSATVRDLGANTRQACCSVIWPEHEETFGDVGIVVRPRSLKSIVLINNGDAGSIEDAATGQRMGMGAAFSAAGVQDTFDHPNGHNEWVIGDADVVGLYVNLRRWPVQVAAKIKLPEELAEVPGEDMITPVNISIETLRSDFPNLPIFAYQNGSLIQLIANSPYA